MPDRSPAVPLEARSMYGTHLLHHLTAYGAGLTAGKIAVIALLEVDADLAGGFHLELVHSSLGLGDVELVAVLAGHNDFLLLFECLVGFVAFGYRKHSFAGFFVGMQSERR